jgi:ketosteroid isomerase-like protein
MGYGVVRWHGQHVSRRGGSQASNARTAIARVNQQFEEAFNRGDMAGAAAVYTEQATVLLSNNRHRVRMAVYSC